MNVLQIIAHPNLEDGFTNALAAEFRRGANHHNVQWYNLFDPDADEINHQERILAADHLCFAYPCWWEMPPAKLVQYFQTVFVKGFAFDTVGLGNRRLRFVKNATCLISLGQNKDLSTENLRDAMTYCGLIPQFALFKGVGPLMTEQTSTEYLSLAHRLGAAI